MPSASTSTRPRPGPAADPPRGHPVRRRPRPGRQRGDLDGRGLVPPPRHRGPRHPARLCPPGRVRRRPPDGGGPRLHRPGPDATCKRHAEHARHLDRHLADEPRQGRVAARPTCPIPSAPPSSGTVHRALDSLGVDALVSIGGDDTLKTANKFKRFQDYLPAGRPADRGGPRPQDDRQRLPRHRLHLRLFHGRRDPGRRDPQPAGRRRGGPDVLPGRDHGPQRRLAGLRRRHRRRGQPGHQRRGPHRRAHDRGDRHRPQDRPRDHPQGHEHRQDRRSDRPRDDRPREGGQGVRRDRAGRGAGPVHARRSYLEGVQVRRSRATSRCRRPTWPAT